MALAFPWCFFPFMQMQTEFPSILPSLYFDSVSLQFNWCFIGNGINFLFDIKIPLNMCRQCQGWFWYMHYNSSICSPSSKGLFISMSYNLGIEKIKVSGSERLHFFFLLCSWGRSLRVECPVLKWVWNIVVVVAAFLFSISFLHFFWEAKWCIQEEYSYCHLYKH